MGTGLIGTNHEDTKDTKVRGKAVAQFEQLPSATEEIGKCVVQAAFNVHRELGPGLLESVYEQCMVVELTSLGMRVARQVSLPIEYREHRIEAGLRLDLLVNDCVIVELKAVDQMILVYEAQLLSYLKLTKLRLGFLINFNVPLIKEGIKRMVL